MTVRSSVEAWRSIPEIDDEADQELHELPDATCPHARMEGLQLAEIVASALLTLTPREERVVRMRFGLGTDEHTLIEVGDAMCIGPERVRQIEAKALRKFKHPSRSAPLKRVFGTWSSAISPDAPDSKAIRIRIKRFHAEDLRRNHIS